MSYKERFSWKVRGLDEDVKEYFLSLPVEIRESVFSRYGYKYGESAKTYAINTFHKWRSGHVEMSGMIAERLFNLLPPIMSLKKKYELAEKLWKHYAPWEHIYESYTIGPYTNMEKLVNEVAVKLDNSIRAYSIPEDLKNSFSWLAQDDIKVVEQLLNHFRHIPKVLVQERIKLEIPVLQKQIVEHADTTSFLKSEIRIDNAGTISIYVDKRLNDEIVKGWLPPRQQRSSGLGCVIIVCILLFWLFALSNY